jgi:amidase
MLLQCLYASSRFANILQNMATADRTQTTAGSWALLGSMVPKDAHIVHLLRRAGAVIIGKSNLDEWAGMRGSRYSVGYSARGGQCRNPYNLSKSPCKSMKPQHLNSERSTDA